MAGMVRVRSVEDLRDFGGALARYHDDARDAVATLESELGQFLRWLQEDRVHHWRMQVKKWRKAFEQARADLSRKRLGQVNGAKLDLIEEQKRLKMTKAKFEEAEEKLRMINQLAREIERQSIDFKSVCRNLSRHLEGDPAPAISRFKRIVDSVESYLAVSSSGTTNASGGTGSAGEHNAGDEGLEDQEQEIASTSDEQGEAL